MNTRLIKTLQHVRELIAQVPLLEPEWESKNECYQWFEGVLKLFRYQSLTRSEKGLIKQYLIPFPISNTPIALSFQAQILR